MPTFLRQEDYGVYLDLMKSACARHGVHIWAYCLMPNHVHLIAVPDRCDGLARAIGQAHLRYTRYINEREGWRGYLWQGRFASFVMDEGHALTAMRYVELNPVRAGLSDSPAAWPWSSARAHLTGNDDPLVCNVRDMIDYVGDWKRYLALDADEEEILRLRTHARTGRPLGDAAFIGRLERSLGRLLAKRKPGPKAPHKEY